MLRKYKSTNLFQNLKHRLIELPKKDDLVKNSWHLFVIKITKYQNKSRDGLVKHLISKKIGTSIHYVPIHKTFFLEKEVENIKKVFQILNELIIKFFTYIPKFKKIQVKRIIREIINYLN